MQGTPLTGPLALKVEDMPTDFLDSQLLQGQLDATTHHNFPPFVHIIFLSTMKTQQQCMEAMVKYLSNN